MGSNVSRLMEMIMMTVGIGVRVRVRIRNSILIFDTILFPGSFQF